MVLAKVDANEESNKELANKYEIQGFPTIKIFRNGGKNVQEFKGPREADGIVAYLKKETGPASVEIKSVEDVTSLIDDSKIFVVSPSWLFVFLFRSYWKELDVSTTDIHIHFFLGWSVSEILWGRIRELLSAS